MLSLIIYLILAIVYGYFATQNTGLITLKFASYKIDQIPLYAALGVTLLLGLLFSWLIGLFGSLATTLKIMGKEHKIQDDKKTIRELTRKINQLELDNAKLTGEIKGGSKDPDSI